jgi:hypothetical protein
MKRYITKVNNNDENVEIMIGEISSSFPSNTELYQNRTLRQLRLFDKYHQTFSNNILFFEYKEHHWFLIKDLCFFDPQSLSLLNLFMDTKKKDGILFEEMIDFLFEEYYNC